MLFCSALIVRATHKLKLSPVRFSSVRLWTKRDPSNSCLLLAIKPNHFVDLLLLPLLCQWNAQWNFSKTLAANFVFSSFYLRYPHSSSAPQTDAIRVICFQKSLPQKQTQKQKGVLVYLLIVVWKVKSKNGNNLAQTVHHRTYCYCCCCRFNSTLESYFHVQFLSLFCLLLL